MKHKKTKKNIEYMNLKVSQKERSIARTVHLNAVSDEKFQLQAMKSTH